jgi:hypothetical protein
MNSIHSTNHTNPHPRWSRSLKARIRRFDPWKDICRPLPSGRAFRLIVVLARGTAWRLEQNTSGCRAKGDLNEWTPEPVEWQEGSHERMCTRAVSDRVGRIRVPPQLPGLQLQQPFSHDT